MGIGVITSEPSYEVLDLVEQLADEYDIKVAFHNHPAPSLYWNPDTVLTALEGRSMNLGFVQILVTGSAPGSIRLNALKSWKAGSSFYISKI